MHIVSSILRRNLLQHDPISVEGVGTLHTTLRNARLLAGQRLEPPRRMPELSATEAGDLPLTEIVAAELSIGYSEAEELCRAWQEEAYRAAEQAGLPSGALLIEGLGTIRYDRREGGGLIFVASPELLEMLNPLPAEPLVVPTATRRLGSGSGAGQPSRRRLRGTRGRNPHHYTVSVLAIAVALTAVGYVAYYLWTHTDLFLALLND
ncbi:MAG: hypothetical protein K2G93_05480 [Rikenella sp.]|nr:hypothetical protein [Rikenella sp.]